MGVIRKRTRLTDKSVLFQTSEGVPRADQSTGKKRRKGGGKNKNGAKKDQFAHASARRSFDEVR